MGSEAPAGCRYLVRDAFGEQYAEAYGIPEPSRIALTALAEASSSDVLVALHAGRDEALRDALDRTGFERGVSSVGVELLPTAIICGPAVIPGATACYACYRRHEEAARPYDVGAATRGLAEGFAQPHLAIAHGLLALALAELRAGPVGIGATVRSFDLVTGTLSTTSTAAADGCSRCGGVRGAPMSAAAIGVGLP
ncbi:hypothetical protein [Amycolatopsis minnesotensis]